MKTIIGFLGRKASGKSTAARFCFERYGSVNVPFAAGVKEMCRRVLPHVPEDAWYGTQDEKARPRPELGGLSGRQVMQNMGNGAREVIGRSVWIDAAFETIRTTNRRIYTIDDVRYANEVDAIQRAGGYVVRLYNTALPNDDMHPSEAESDTIRSERLNMDLRHNNYAGLLENLERFLNSVGLVPR